jgi:hypothetical protein
VGASLGPCRSARRGVAQMTFSNPTWVAPFPNGAGERRESPAAAGPPGFFLAATSLRIGHRGGVALPDITSATVELASLSRLDQVGGQVPKLAV